MPPRRRTLVVKLWTMNAREGNDLVPYGDLFSEVAARDSSDTIQQISNDLSYAIDLDDITDSLQSNHPNRQVFSGQVVAGTPGDVPIYFDYRTGETEQGSTPEGKWLAQVSRIVISVMPDDRYIALESSRNGVTTSRLARYFQLLAENVAGLYPVEFDINPVQSPSLRTEIESFERIREATAVITRPNYDWTDMSDKLAALADESTGHTAEATIRAARSESLSKSGGIVGAILDSLAGKSSTMMHRFKITGRKAHSDRETTLTSEKHQQRAFVKVPPEPSSEADGLVFERSMELIDAQQQIDSSEH